MHAIENKNNNNNNKKNLTNTKIKFDNISLL